MDTKQAALTAPNTVHISQLTPLTLVSPLHINIGDWLGVIRLVSVASIGLQDNKLSHPLSPVSQVHQVQTCDFALWPVSPACHAAKLIPNTRRERGGKVMRNADFVWKSPWFYSSLWNSFLCPHHGFQCYTSHIHTSALLPLPSKTKQTSDWSMWSIVTSHRIMTIVTRACHTVSQSETDPLQVSRCDIGGRQCPHL